LQRFHSSSTPKLNIAGNVKILPSFSESGVDTYFHLFERVATAHAWTHLEQTLLLQCVLSGKAQQAYASLPVAESQVYEHVKAAVLRAYQQVLEAYRQWIRGMQRKHDQSYMEFARDLTLQYKRWCMSSKVQTMEELKNVIFLEQFKNTLPENVATFIVERGVQTASQAAVLADEWELTHRICAGGVRGDRGGLRPHSQLPTVPHGQERDVGKGMSPGSDWSCHYCQESPSTASITMAEISLLLDGHRASIAGDFKSSFESDIQARSLAFHCRSWAACQLSGS